MSLLHNHPLPRLPSAGWIEHRASPFDHVALTSSHGPDLIHIPSTVRARPGRNNLNHMVDMEQKGLFAEPETWYGRIAS